MRDWLVLTGLIFGTLLVLPACMVLASVDGSIPAWARVPAAGVVVWWAWAWWQV